jgi:hypothetical protein
VTSTTLKRRSKRSARSRRSRESGEPHERVYGQWVLERTQVYRDRCAERDGPIPTLAGLAAELGVVEATVRRWAADETKEDFAFLVEMLARRQAHMLINRGLLGQLTTELEHRMCEAHIVDQFCELL